LAEDTTMNNWYATERIAHERHADFQREADVISLLTSLEDIADPKPGPIDRLFRSVDRLKARLTGVLDRRVGRTGHRGMSGVERHG
jgi:hypothetical protein